MNKLLNHSKVTCGIVTVSIMITIYNRHRYLNSVVLVAYAFNGLSRWNCELARQWVTSSVCNYTNADCNLSCVRRVSKLFRLVLCTDKLGMDIN